MNDLPVAPCTLCKGEGKDEPYGRQRARTPQGSGMLKGASPSERKGKDAGGNRTHFDRVAAGCLAIQLQRHVASSATEEPPNSQARPATAPQTGAYRIDIPEFSEVRVVWTQ